MAHQPADQAKETDDRVQPVEELRAEIARLARIADQADELRAENRALRARLADRLSEPAERALWQSERRYQTFVALSSEGVWCIDLDNPLPQALPETEQVAWLYEHGTIAECNSAAARLLGYDRPDDLIGSRLGQLLPMLSTRNAEGLRAFVRSRYHPTEIESQELDQQAGIRYFLNLLIGVVEDGHLVRVWGVKRDLTERITAEIERSRLLAEVQHERDRLLALIDSTVDEIWFCDRDGRLVLVNAAAAQAFGLTQEGGELPSLPGWLPTAEIYTLDGRLRPLEETPLLRALRGVPVTVEEVVRLPQTGELRYRQVTAAPVRTPSGEIAGAVAAVRDVTAHKQLEHDLRRTHGELATLLDIAGSLASELEIDAVLDHIAGWLGELIDYTGLIVWQLVDHDRQLMATEYRGPAPRDEMLGVRLPLDQAPGLAAAIFGRRPVIIDDLEGDSPLARSSQQTMDDLQRKLMGPARSWMGVPLIVRDRVIGALRLVHPKPGRFSDHDGELALAFAHHAAMALENARLYAQARELAVLEERQRLARDLHDAVSQTLFSAGLVADVLPVLYDRDPELGRRQLAELRQLTRGAHAEMRMLLLELRPAALLETGLDVLLHQLAAGMRGRSQLDIDVAAHQTGPLPDEVQVGLYRIVQEAVNNIAKHARACHAALHLTCDSGHAELNIIDDGCGFDPRAVPSGRLGLAIMAERARAIGATLQVDSTPGDGTRITVTWHA